MFKQVTNHSSSRVLLGAVLLVSAAALGAAALPAQMKAARTDTDGAPGTLKIVTVDVPKPGDGQVLLQVYAASANPSDWVIRGGGAPRAGGAGGPPRDGGGGPGANSPAGGRTAVPMIARNPGNDVSGVVVAVGNGVTEYRAGDQIVAALQESGGGAYAEYALANVERMSLKPKSFSYEQAAGIPTAGFTGLRMVILGQVKKGDRVLVIGAAGGVGSTAVQASKARGAHVITSASSRHESYLKQLGADEIYDYDKVNIAEKVKDVDVVINSVGTENAAAMGYVKRGGRLITISGQADAAACTAAGITCMSGGAYAVGANSGGPTVGELIRELVKMADAGQFTVVIDKTFPLEQINEAYAFGREGNREGKLAISVRKDSATK